MKFDQKALGDLVTLEYGKALVKEDRTGGKYPVYGSGGIVGYHNEPLTGGPTIIIGRKGSIGEVYYSEIPCWVIDTAYYVKYESKKVYLRWLEGLLRYKRLDRLEKSAAIPGLNRDDIYTVKVSIPTSLEDQIRIGTLLLKLKSLLEYRRKSIEFLNQLFSSVFIKIFGDPVSNSKQWDLTVLSDLGVLNRGVSRHRPRNAPELLGGPYPLIQTSEISNSDLYIKDYTQTYSELGLEQSKLWPKGTLCITIAANIAKTAILDFEACFPDSIVGFIPNNKVTKYYVHFLFGFIQEILEKNAPQSAQKNINLTILRSLEVPNPPIELQKEFAYTVNMIQALKENFKNNLEELENLYGALSQRAFKGDLDLSFDVSKELQEYENQLLDDQSEKQSDPDTTVSVEFKVKKKEELTLEENFARLTKNEFGSSNFKFEELIGFLRNNHPELVKYYSTKDLKMKSKLSEKDIKSLIFECLEGENRELELKQEFYNLLDNKDLQEINLQDKEDLLENTRDLASLSGIYLSIKS